MNNFRIYGYAPVVSEDSRVLILGSMPSAKSLEMGFYYAHPQNSFWRILANAYAQPLPETVAQKTALLLANRLALWDAVFSCEREGSLDSAIRFAQRNDFQAFFSRYPRIERVLFNGAAAEKLYGDKSGLGRPYLRLPSTSPAYTLPYGEKLAAWRAALLRG